jgi:site-specific DNA-methyltransferase (adenine-specific)
MIDLRLGDCLVVMKSISDKSIDAIICDLPYGTTACKWDSVIPFEPLWVQYKRIIKDNGAIVLTASQPFTTALIASNIENFRHSWVWDKGVAASFALCNKQPMKVHEDILVFSNKLANYYPIMTLKDKPLTVKHNDKKFETAPLAKRFDKPITYTHSYPRSILDISTRKEQRGKVHPTQKPLALMEYLVKTYTNQGNTVLDNCMGSGTTGIACKNLNRNFIGIEKDPNYFEIAKNRINGN